MSVGEYTGPDLSASGQQTLASTLASTPGTNETGRKGWGPPGYVKGQCNSDLHKGTGTLARSAAAFFCEDCQAQRKPKSKKGSPTSGATGTTQVKAPPSNPVGGAAGAAGTAAGAANTLVDPKEEAEAKSKAQEERIKAAITDQLNPLLLETFANLCKPADPSNFYSLKIIGQNKDGTPETKAVPTELGSQIVFGSMEAAAIAKGVTKASELPMFKVTSTVAGPYVGYAFMGAAVLVVGMKATKLMTLRNQIVAEATKQTQVGQTVSPPPGEQRPAQPNGMADSDLQPPGPTATDPAFADTSNWGKAPAGMPADPFAGAAADL